MFFFSSRRRHTRWTGDWSSDVCSSDLRVGGRRRAQQQGEHEAAAEQPAREEEELLGAAAATYATMRVVRLSPAEAIRREIGRASCRERVGMWGGTVSMNTTTWSVLAIC